MNKHEGFKKKLTYGPNDATGVVWAIFRLLLSQLWLWLLLLAVLVVVVVVAVVVVVVVVGCGCVVVDVVKLRWSMMNDCFRHHKVT